MDETMLRKDDFPKICRFCLAAVDPGVSIFKLKFEQVLFTDILSHLFSIQISRDDELPENICSTCIYEIIRCQTFVNNQAKSRKILEGIIAKHLDEQEQSAVDAKEIIVETENEERVEHDDERSDDEVGEQMVIDEGGEEVEGEAHNTSNGVIDLEEQEEEDPLAESSSEHQAQAQKEEEVVAERSPERQAIAHAPNQTRDKSPSKSPSKSPKASPKASLKAKATQKNKSEAPSSPKSGKSSPSKLDDNPHMCSCKKSFPTKFELKRHKQSADHPPQRNMYVACPICTKKIRHRDINNHISLIHHKEKQYECEICSAKFATRGQMNRHLVTHPSEKPFRCDHMRCGKRFLTEEGLRKHQEVHNKSKKSSAGKETPQKSSATKETPKKTRNAASPKKTKPPTPIPSTDNTPTPKKAKANTLTPKQSNDNTPTPKKLKPVTSQHSNENTPIAKKAKALTPQQSNENTSPAKKAKANILTPQQSNANTSPVTQSSSNTSTPNKKSNGNAVIPTVTYGCSCGEFFKTYDQFLQHTTLDKEQEFEHVAYVKTFICEVCSAKFAAAAALRKHMMSHRVDRRHACDACGKSYVHFAVLKQHKKRCQGQAAPKRAQASPKRSSPVKRKAAAPKRKGSPKPRAGHKAPAVVKPPSDTFQCNWCKETFKSITVFIEHRRQDDHFPISHDPNSMEPYECLICEKKFPNRQFVIAHLDAHENVKGEFQCKQCGASFTQSWAYESHLEKKHVKKPVVVEECFKCEHCSESFTSNVSLQTHMVRHEVRPDVKKVACGHCVKKFLSHGELKKHVDSEHATATPFVCGICDKAFKTRKYLATHIRSHTGEKPYNCEYCSKLFTRYSPYKRHLKVHIDKT